MKSTKKKTCQHEYKEVKSWLAECQKCKSQLFFTCAGGKEYGR